MLRPGEHAALFMRRGAEFDHRGVKRLGIAGMQNGGQIRIAARATGKVILDGVYNDIKADAGFEAECLQGRQMGFDGKTLIHPSQITPANDTFGPSEKELVHARKVVSAYEEAQAAGRSVTTVDGRMIENLHVRDAQRILALADLISDLEGAVSA